MSIRKSCSGLALVAASLVAASMASARAASASACRLGKGDRQTARAWRIIARVVALGASS